jgi:hypothetical protein
VTNKLITGLEYRTRPHSRDHPFESSFASVNRFGKKIVNEINNPLTAEEALE